MMNIENAGTNTTQYILQPLPKDVSGNGATDFQAERIIKKARAMISLQNNADIRTKNLLQMAETALKNGNPASANVFAQKVLQIVIPRNPVKTPPEARPIPEPEIPAEGKSLPGKKRHTEHTYQDASNDPGVSFTYPGRLTGPESFLAVRAHEYEHVRRSLRDAVLNGKPMMVLVSYKVRFDPATGEAYMAGGVTRTIRLPEIPEPEKGKAVDIYA
jgi:hypothetical protein